MAVDTVLHLDVRDRRVVGGGVVHGNGLVMAVIDTHTVENGGQLSLAIGCDSRREKYCRAIGSPCRRVVGPGRHYERRYAPDLRKVFHETALAERRANEGCRSGESPTNDGMRRGRGKGWCLGEGRRNAGRMEGEGGVHGCLGTKVGLAKRRCRRYQSRSDRRRTARPTCTKEIRPPENSGGDWNGRLRKDKLCRVVMHARIAAVGNMLLVLSCRRGRTPIAHRVGTL